MMSYSWVPTRSGAIEAEPHKGSRFILRVQKVDGEGWYATVGGNDVDEGKAFASAEEAQAAAEASYDGYYVDFEEPTEGF